MVPWRPCRHQTQAGAALQFLVTSWGSRQGKEMDSEELRMLTDTSVLGGFWELAVVWVG